MNKGVLVWGYLASFILLLGSIFMNLNFLAGKVLYLTGFFAFNLGYLLPLFWTIFQQNQENKIGLVLIFGLLGFLTFLTGVSFFAVNWGGGIVLIYTGGGILILAVLTLIALSRRFYETHIDSWFPVLIFGVFIVVSLLTSMVHRHVMRVFSLNNKQMFEMVESINQKNTELYQQLIWLDTLKNQEFIHIKHTVMALQAQSDNFYVSVESLKTDLIKRVEGESYKLLERQALDNLVPVQSNVEINSVNRFMLGSKKGKAFWLKNLINNYHQFIATTIPPNEGWLLSYTNKNLSTTPYPLNNRFFNRTWEQQNFYNFPLVTVLNQLTSLQWRAKVVEAEVLNYYYKQALRLGKGNIMVIDTVAIPAK